jgi:hypothetical protein
MLPKGLDLYPGFTDTLYNQISNIKDKTCTVTSWLKGSKRIDATMNKLE